MGKRIAVTALADLIAEIIGGILIACFLSWLEWEPEPLVWDSVDRVDSPSG